MLVLPSFTEGLPVAALEALALPTRLPTAMSAAAVLEASRSDKKVRAARLHYALVAEPGRMARPADGGWSFALEDEVVIAALEELRERPGAGGVFSGSDAV